MKHLPSPQKNEMRTSVCIATYNGEHFIKEQLESILSQLRHTDEVIISDDNSTDDTLSVIKALNDPRIKIILRGAKKENSPHSNVSSNFEHALKKSSGDLILLSDQDDIWEDTKLEEIKKHIQGCDLVTSDAYLLQNHNERISSSFYSGGTPITNLAGKLYRIRYHGCTMAFTRKVLEYAIPFPDNLEVHDAWLGLIAELTGKAKHIDRKLIKYRIHNGNTSKQSNNNLLHKLAYRARLFKDLYYRYRAIYPNSNLCEFISKLNKNDSTGWN